jgi:16S rRNA (cytosine1402-N4)-methyltransferase
MLDESLELLLPERERRKDATIVDATFGAGGHTKAILARMDGGRVIAFDADPAAVGRAEELGREHPGRVIAVHANFADLDEKLDEIDVGEVDGILYDLGLSSLQLADPARGFSFAGTEPLDMRLDPTSDDPTAADLLATMSERELSDIIFENGDDRYARRIARQIVTRRQRSPLRTTSDLVAAVLSAQPRGAKRTPIHPATRTFQALRMAVNRDLERLDRSLEAGLRRLRTDARVVVISFHSGEDRAVKQTFKRWERERRICVLTKKPLTPSSDETAANPRARSAKLRAAQRITEDPSWR